MADRILTWFIPGVLSNNVEGTNASIEYVADEDYRPVVTLMSQKEAQAGEANVIDINDDGVSIFGDIKPSLNQGVLTSEFDVFSSSLAYIAKGSVITLDIDQISGTTPGSSLTVHLELVKI
jgi:hypothetical protein